MWDELTAVAATRPDTAFEQVAPAATIEDLFAICEEIDDYSVLRGGPEVYVTR